MRVYVASAFYNRFKVREVMKLLEDHGHTITMDWTRIVLPSKCSDRIASMIMGIQADRDMRGVLSTDVLLLMLPGRRGAHGELAAAIARNKVSIIVGRRERECLWQWHPRVIHFECLDDAIKLIDKLERKAQDAAIAKLDNLDCYVPDLS